MLTDETPPLALSVDHAAAAEALRAVYAERFGKANGAGNRHPQLQLQCGGSEPTIEVDGEGQIIRITGDPIPYTLIKQGIRWTAAAVIPYGWLPFHAVVVRFRHNCLAIVGRGRAGKSYLAQRLLAHTSGHILSDDWALIDVDTHRPRWPGDHLLHIRGSDLASVSDPESLVAFELAENDPYHRESRYLIPRRLEPTMALPSKADTVTHIAFIGEEREGLHFARAGDARERERELRTYLWDDSLSMLPDPVAARLNTEWNRLLDGVQVAVIEGHRSSVHDTDRAVDAICRGGVRCHESSDVH